MEENKFNQETFINFRSYFDYMTLPRIEERTLYSPIIEYLKELGFESVGETTVTKKHPDILFKLSSTSFVIEVKIGKPEVGLSAMAQAYGYAKNLRTENIIILIYPEKFRNQTILDMRIVPQIALDEEINALILTEFWTEKVKDKPKNIFRKLKNIIAIEKIKIDFKTVVDLIGSYVKDLNSIIYQVKTDELISEVVEKLNLFTSIGEIRDKELAKKQIMNLSSYLLFNQLLFYHIYKKRTKNMQLNDLDEIYSVKEIQRYFDAITDIDYQSIYRVNILGHVPDRPEIIQTLNELINAIKLLRAEHITHDLAGRFFHDLIPSEVRKVLAAFYTHPNAAKILADLTIDSWDETVIDPACGSGTLLVSAYERKQELYTKLYGFKDLGEVHKRFIEEDITGIDIMPFAGHITTINLTMQNIEQETNIVRIGCRDSLSLAKNLKNKDFTEFSGIKISSYSEKVQKTLSGIYEEKVMGTGAISPKGKGEEFYLRPFDVLLMNPPFSDREKMPEDMRNEIKSNKILGNISGHRINLWGYFLALADLLLKPNGKMGVVIPINIARGKATEKIRNYLLKNYHIKYIIKPVGDLAFSEGAAFRDILFIAEKRKPEKHDLTAIIFLKKSIREINIEKTKKIIEKIYKIEPKKDYSYSNEDFDIFFIGNDKLLDHKSNLMPLLWASHADSIHNIERFLELIRKKSTNILVKIKKESLREGFHSSPKGMSEMVYITRPLEKSRITRAFLILDKEDKEYVYFRIKKTNLKFKIKKDKILPALRTLTGIKNLELNNNSDYIILYNFKGFDQILRLSKWKNKKNFNWNSVLNEAKRKKSYLALSYRINPYSKNTSFLAVSNTRRFIPSDGAFKVFMVKNNKDAIMLSLDLNSIHYLTQFFINKGETTGQFSIIRSDEFALIDIIDLNKLSTKEKESLLNLFEKLKDVEFPSIIEQLENRFWARVELDKTILKILGFSDGEINEWLPKVYDTLVSELKAMKEVK